MGTTAPVTIEIETKSPKQVIDITGQVGAALDGVPGGTCHLYLKHTTAALTVMTWEAGVPEDIMDILQSLTPKLAYRHDSAAHVAAHFLSALVGPSVHVPVQDGRLALGRVPAGGAAGVRGAPEAGDHGGRSPLHPHRRGGGLLRADPARHRHRVPQWRDALPAGEGQDPARLRARLYQRLAHRKGRLRLPGRTVQRLSTRRRTTTARAGTTSSTRTAMPRSTTRWQTRAA